jgi:hypothetical protein
MQQWYALLSDTWLNAQHLFMAIAHRALKRPVLYAVTKRIAIVDMGLIRIRLIHIQPIPRRRAPAALGAVVVDPVVA